MTVQDEEQCSLTFEVSDTGIGIEASELAKIFEPFAQVGDQREQEKGTGLGLAICKQYVELLNGRIGVTSQVNEGSRFYIEIPAKLSNKDVFVPNNNLKHPIGMVSSDIKSKILIVEDQYFNKLLLTKILEPYDFDIATASDGIEALELIPSFQPDLIFMDIRMAKMDGIEATRQIKALPEGKTIKIIATTAHALEEERLHILNSGCDDFIRKPFNDSDIYDALTRHLGLIFLYEPDAMDSTIHELVNIQSLKAVDPILLNALLTAAIELDQNTSLNCIDRLEPLADDIKKALRRHIEIFEFDYILRLVESVQKSKADDSDVMSLGW